MSRAGIKNPKSRRIMHGFIEDPTPLSCKEVGNKFDLPRITAFDNLKPLVYKGLMKKVERHNNRGRPTILYKPNSEILCYKTGLNEYF